MLYQVATPGNPPADLVALSPKVLKSVVTVYCGAGLGTGWAAKVEIPASAASQGIKTFLVTNHHVVEDCISSGEVTIVDSNNNSSLGFITAADATNDLAGIYPTAELPTLSFRGQTPAQGWWVGVLGSPRGLEGYLTTGLVSKVAADGGEIGISASLNPGNSGGPIFDREGRVLAVATYKLLESESLGFAKSTPLLCQQIISCSQANPIWSTQLSPKVVTVVSQSPVATTEIVKNATLPSFATNKFTLTSTE